MLESELSIYPAELRFQGVAQSVRYSPGESHPEAAAPLSEKNIYRLFSGDRECSKVEHATQWLLEWRGQNPGRGRLPSAQRVRNGVLARYHLSISKPIALAAISQVRTGHTACIAPPAVQAPASRGSGHGPAAHLVAPAA
jgi:hypothetical protein